MGNLVSFRLLIKLLSTSAEQSLIILMFPQNFQFVLGKDLLSKYSNLANSTSLAKSLSIHRISSDSKMRKMKIHLTWFILTLTLLWSNRIWLRTKRILLCKSGNSKYRKMKSTDGTTAYLFQDQLLDSLKLAHT